MPKEVFEKYEKLKQLIGSYEKAGVAFSGGIDSSLLLFTAGEVLGRDNVIALHGRSILNSADSDLEELFFSCFQSRAQLKIIDLDPLGWPEFVNNDAKRCYHCKKKTYTVFLQKLAQMGIEVLFDGTNRDDTFAQRPGHIFLREAGVKTPLADSLLTKKDIRFLARLFGLPHHSKPSNSCLATRLEFFPRIERDGLRMVEEIESKLKKMGYTDCRVRPRKKSIVIEIRQQHFNDISKKHNRLKVRELAAEYGFKKVLVDLQGRQ